MHNNILLILALCIIFYTSCKEHNNDVSRLVYHDGRIEFTFKLKNDTLDYKVIIVSPQGDTQRILYLKDSCKHGIDSTFHKNGKVEFTGNWYYGFRKGTFTEYDSFGRRIAIRRYIIIADSSKSYLNEVIRFNQNGDTLHNTSTYYDLYSSSKTDTITNGEKISFKIVLRGALFDSAYVSFCDLDKYYRTIDSSSCDTFLMQKMSISLQHIKYNIGENIYSGTIINYGKPFDTSQYKQSQIRVIYFRHSYYVKP